MNQNPTSDKLNENNITNKTMFNTNMKEDKKENNYDIGCVSEFPESENLKNTEIIGPYHQVKNKENFENDSVNNDLQMTLSKTHLQQIFTFFTNQIKTIRNKAGLNDWSYDPGLEVIASEYSIIECDQEIN